jgi:hypothetical protein
MARFLEMGGGCAVDLQWLFGERGVSDGVLNGLFCIGGLKKWSPPVVPGMHEVHFSENG